MNERRIHKIFALREHKLRIPAHADHQFHGESITDSTASRSLIPRLADQ